MGRPYSMDLRHLAMDLIASGESCHEVAAALKVAPSSVIKWAQRYRQTGVWHQARWVDIVRMRSPAAIATGYCR